MYSRFQLAKKYLHYYRHADNAKGHGVHSPFVFDFIIHVLNSNTTHKDFHLVEKYRRRLLKDHRKITVQDFGAGSALIADKERRLSGIAASSPKNKKFATLLYRIANYYGCKDIVELGTSLGTTTAYLALSSPDSHVATLEGADRIADIAEDFFHTIGLNNITLYRGDFAKTIPVLMKDISGIDLLFVDGNHQEVPTVNYFESFLEKANNDSIFIFDDIHWSEGMERAWQRITDHPSVTLSIDLFFIGIVFFKKKFMVKQHFVVKF